jgi:hypothetical protein
MLAAMMKTVAQKLLSDFESSKKVPHNLAKGEAREAAVLQDFLKPYLPSRYSIERNGILIDIENKSSKQQDLVIFDAFFSPILHDFGAGKLFFPESVFATIEIKTLLTREELKDILEKSISVWELKRTIPSNLILAPGIIMPSNQVRTLCIGFCYEARLTIAEARDELRSLRQTMPTAHALSVLCILQDKDGKCGLVVNVSPEELRSIVIMPLPASRLAVIECESAGEALLYVYLILMEHLRSCGIIMPIPNLMEYAKVSLGSPKLQVAREDMKGAFVSIEEKRLSTDMLQDISEWTKKLYAQQISDDELLDLFYHLPKLPGGEVLLDPRSLFKEQGHPLLIPGTRVVYDTIKRRKEGKATSEDELLLASFVTLIRNVIAQKRSIEMGP